VTFLDLEFNAFSRLLSQMGVVLFVSRALAPLVRRLRQPLVIAEILAGIVLGPSVLGWLWPEASAALFPASSLALLKELSQVGLVLFMFLVGLELDPALLRGRTQASVLISFSSILLPFLLGVGVAAWLYPSYAPSGVPATSFLLFLGVSMSVTAFPVLARILSERRLTTSRVGALALACAAVDDVSAWCILAIIVAVARAEGMSRGLRTLALSLAFVALLLGLVRPLMKRIGESVARRGELTPSVVATTLGLLLLASMTTELIGIHALFGAFLFGAILPRERLWTHALAGKVETVAVVLLMPLFFAYSGLRTNIGLIQNAGDWLVAAALIGCATLGKFGGSAAAARLTGLRWREASAVGILMNTRGLMELIVLNIGQDLGIISPALFTMLVFMALATTAATTPLLRWIYPDHELARDSLPVEQPFPVAVGSSL
jgi:Kef-type K+ transport system membrane component KefB